MSELEKRAKTAKKTLSQWIEKAIYDYQCSEDFRNEAGKEAGYCPCHITKTYKEVNPSIVANYEEFIQGYDPEWFAHLNLSAPFTPTSKDEEEDVFAAPTDALLHSYLYF
ncbi:hypothetical protein LIER_27583 [Lithospermum erythrorhizon]|uniref:Uncharacterized protein n=1 Tax=Lithospermum erythrorhizon TaxID=34254 RepID=A0AAV3RCV2_LITER